MPSKRDFLAPICREVLGSTAERLGLFASVQQKDDVLFEAAASSARPGSPMPFARHLIDEVKIAALHPRHAGQAKHRWLSRETQVGEHDRA